MVEKVAEAEQPICGIIMPISAVDPDYSKEHWSRVRAILEKAIGDAGMKPQPVWENQPNDIIQARILRNLYENELVVCDVSARNANVMLELGMRLSTKKPTILVADDETKLPFDTSVIAHSFYQRDLEYTAISRFLSDLTAAIRQLRKDVSQNRYVSFVENFPIETVEPSMVSVSAAERLDDVSASVRRIEELLIDRHLFPAAGQQITQDVHGLNTFGKYPVGNDSPSATAPNRDIQLGTRVYHSKFGFGTVVYLEGNKLEADFDKAGRKRVLHAFVTVADDGG
jgi:hypothetical protein